MKAKKAVLLLAVLALGSFLMIGIGCSRTIENERSDKFGVIYVKLTRTVVSGWTQDPEVRTESGFGNDYSVKLTNKHTAQVTSISYTGDDGRIGMPCGKSVMLAGDEGKVVKEGCFSYYGL